MNNQIVFINLDTKPICVRTLKIKHCVKSFEKNILRSRTKQLKTKQNGSFNFSVQVHFVGMPSDAIFSLNQRNLVSDDKISTPIFFYTMTKRFDLKHVKRIYISLSIGTKFVSLSDISTLTGQKYFRTKIVPYIFHIKPFIFITFS